LGRRDNKLLIKPNPSRKRATGNDKSRIGDFDGEKDANIILYERGRRETVYPRVSLRGGDGWRPL